MNYTSRTYQLNGIELTFKVKKAELNNGYVESQFFRNDSQNLPFSKVVLTDEETFFSEIAFLIDKCQSNTLNTDTIFNSFFELIKIHVGKCGRLIDNDLESYLDRILLVMATLQNSNDGNRRFSIDQALQLRNGFRKVIVENLTPFIFVTRRDRNGKAMLVKLTELNN